MAESAQTSTPDIFCRMAFDLLDDILLATKDPELLSAKVAEKLRELTGARTVVVAENLEPFSGEGQRVLAVNPEQCSSLADDPRLSAWLNELLLARQAEICEMRISEEEDLISFGMPLLTGNSENIGAILMLDLADDDNDLPQMKKFLIFLLRYISETMHSSFIRYFQRDLINQRTNALWQEIEERRAVEITLRKSRDEWEKTFDAMPDVVTLQDAEMTILRANRAALDLFDLRFDELIGKKCYEVFGAFSFPCPGCPALESEEGIRAHTDTIRHDRLNKVFQVKTAPILDDQGGVAYVIHIAKDVTDEKRLEEELMQAQKMEAVGTLAGGIAHDFNNILSAIIGYSEIIKMGLPAGDPVSEDVDEITRAGKRAAELIKQILTFSRKDSAAIEVFEPHLIVAESLKMLRSSIPTTVEIVDRISHDCGYILANPTRVHQIMMNLCTNAVHAMENEKGTLTIRLERFEDLPEAIRAEKKAAGPYVMLSVEDTGCGIDRELLDRIFEPYYTTKEVERGTGLGLAVVHGIVRDARGFIKVNSGPGKGSRFDIYLPAEEKNSGREQQSDVSSIPLGTEHVLIVDDEKAITQVNQSLLESLGYKTTVEENSQHALNIFLADPEHFDLILTDQTMPILSGSELAKKVLDVRPDMPIVLCTGYSSVISEEQALDAGIRKYLLKPVTRESLARSVREALDQKS